MINDEKKVQEFAGKFKERIIKNCNFADALNTRKALTLRNGQLDAKISEYTTRREALILKDKTLGSEVASAISDGKNPDALSKKRREIHDEISDLSTWIEESEKLLTTVQADEQKSIAHIHHVLNVAAGLDKGIMTDELNGDLKKIEDKLEGWYAACHQLSTDYDIASIERGIVLTNRDVKHCLP